MSKDHLFKKGQVANPKGRPKGSQNKRTLAFKDALNDLLEYSAPHMVEWLKEIDDPERRFQVLKDFAEYIHPKLSRSESTVTVNSQEDWLKRELEHLESKTTDTIN